VSTEENPVRIRTARPYDAAALLDLKRQLDEETSFMAGRGIGTGLLRYPQGLGRPRTASTASSSP
jgi:hypothetical protein